MLHSDNEHISKQIKHTQIIVYWEIYKHSDLQNELKKKEAENQEASKLKKLKEEVESEKIKQEMNFKMKISSEKKMLISALKTFPVINSPKRKKK
ncbi:hypothetical protein BH10BAC5_BH10BAC5_10250 [soil metagenome]